MSILRAMYAGVAGLAAESGALGVVGDNVANTSTVGFKQSRAIFADILGAAVGSREAGSGVRMVRAQQLFGQGAIVTTGQATDVALSGDGFPGWYENILSPQMLLRVPKEQRADLLLEVDVKGLAAWLSLQPMARREALVGQLSTSVQTALTSSMTFGSRTEQLELAHRGQGELVASVKRRIARGTLSFPELVN